MKKHFKVCPRCDGRKELPSCGGSPPSYMCDCNGTEPCFECKGKGVINLKDKLKAELKSLEKEIKQINRKLRDNIYDNE